jgi:hypothetical protein
MGEMLIRQKTPAEIEQRHLEYSLAEHGVALAGQIIVLFVGLALASTTIVCLLRGSPWPVPTGTGGAGAAALLLACRRRPH